MRLGDAIAALRPGAEWSLPKADDYDSLVWLDKAQAKPTRAEVTQAMADGDVRAETERLRVLSIRADAGRADLLSRLQTATPAQIDAFVDGATTTAQLRTILKAIIKAIALDDLRS